MSLKGFCWFLPLLWGLSARAADPLEGAALSVPLPYAAPAAGSYHLPVMGSAADGQVLESNGSATSLSALIKGRVVLLSFIYTTCDDAGGCPMATMVLHQVEAALLKHPALKARVRLMTLSFDPDKDTPAVMARFGASLNAAASDWHFLTTSSKKDLEPILKAYGQSLDAEQTPKGQRFSHVLRLFL
ncbi:MAG: SCO family protein, partial [Gammaproteobacteria bacterium]|nr:SCO family protein [Gammaproteobacteria bacterium]